MGCFLFSVIMVMFGGVWWFCEFVRNIICFSWCFRVWFMVIFSVGNVVCEVSIVISSFCLMFSFVLM